MSERISLVALCVALVAGGAFAWWLRLQPPLAVDVSPLESLPLHLDGWRSIDLEVDDRVADELAADFNIQRAYRHPTGHLIWLYVGYYSTERGGRPEHTPRGCYTGAGWEILESDVLDVPDGRIREFVVRRGGEHRLVHFWFRSHRRGGMTGGIDLGLDRVVGRLTTGRADGGLVRISTPLERREDAPAARSRLSTFRDGLVGQLARHWPGEWPAVASRTRRGTVKFTLDEVAIAARGWNDGHPAGSNRESRITSPVPQVTYESAGSAWIATDSRPSGNGSPVALHSGLIRISQ